MCERNQTVESTELLAGQVKFYSIKHEYGFITMSDGVDVYFRHQSVICDRGGGCVHTDGICARALAPGTNVVFRMAKTNRGVEARNIRVGVLPPNLAR